MLGGKHVPCTRTHAHRKAYTRYALRTVPPTRLPDTPMRDCVCACVRAAASRLCTPYLQTHAHHSTQWHALIRSSSARTDMDARGLVRPLYGHALESAVADVLSRTCGRRQPAPKRSHMQVHVMRRASPLAARRALRGAARPQIRASNSSGGAASARWRARTLTTLPPVAARAVPPVAGRLRVSRLS